MAQVYGGPKNGVLTALEDLKGNPEVDFFIIPFVMVAKFVNDSTTEIKKNQ